MKLLPRRNDLFDDMFDDVFNAPMFSNSSNEMMKTDISEKDGNYYFDIEMPGFKKEDINISLYQGNLTIEASRSNSSEEKDDKGNLIKQERFTGKCSRSFYLGENIKEEDIKAKYENGELRLIVPTEEKKEIENKKLISIE